VVLLAGFHQRGLPELGFTGVISRRDSSGVIFVER
jgi:hypothetical protein